MRTAWKELGPEQAKEAPPSTCRYCSEPIYWEAVRSGKKQPVNATDFERHYCNHAEKHRPRKETSRGAVDNPECQLVTGTTGGKTPAPARGKEAEMLTNKGHCPHGEFILTEGCPQCIAERQAKEARGEEGIAKDEESLAMNQQGQAELAAIEEEGKISPYALPSQAYDEYFTPPEAHTYQPYRLADGTIVPSVTRVLNVLDKGEGMQYWAWDLGRQGLDYREVRDAAARIGTITHCLIASHLKGESMGTDCYSPDEAEKAIKCCKKYLAWEKENPLTPVMIEEPLVSEEYKYGGTPDLLAEINGEFVLIDFKTGSRIYDSYLHQVAAYGKLLEEQGWPVTSAWILRISPDDDQYEVGMLLDFERDWQIFQHALTIYRLQEDKVTVT